MSITRFRPRRVGLVEDEGYPFLRMVPGDWFWIPPTGIYRCDRFLTAHRTKDRRSIFRTARRNGGMVVFHDGYKEINEKEPPKYPFRSLEVGQSFLLPRDDARECRSAMSNYGKKHGRKYKSLAEGLFIRIWRES